jgi:hypothetical protein
LRILKSVPFSDPSPVKLTTAAKPDMLSEVVVRQRLRVDFVISAGVAKSIRLKLRNRGLQVRVLPGVFGSDPVAERGPKGSRRRKVSLQVRVLPGVFGSDPVAERGPKGSRRRKVSLQVRVLPGVFERLVFQCFLNARRLAVSSIRHLSSKILKSVPA